MVLGEPKTIVLYRQTRHITPPSTASHMLSTLKSQPYIDTLPSQDMSMVIKLLKCLNDKSIHVAESSGSYIYGLMERK